MLSALCHDMGKPATAVFNESKGVYQNIGHEEAGVAPAKAFLDRVVNNTATRDYVLNMVEMHGKPYTAFAGKARVSRTNYMFDDIKHGEDMIYLTLSDKHNMPDDKLAEYEAWISDRLHIYEETVSKPQVGGKDLIEMGLKPGKEFSGLISEAHKLHLGGQSKDNVMTTFRHRFGIPDVQEDAANDEGFNL